MLRRKVSDKMRDRFFITAVVWDHKPGKKEVGISGKLDKLSLVHKVKKVGGYYVLVIVFRLLPKESVKLAAGPAFAGYYRKKQGVVKVFVDWREYKAWKESVLQEQ